MKLKDKVFYIESPKDIYKYSKETISKIKHNKIITIIGCGGNRDKTKRPEMGYISCLLSDYVIFTSDNPREEKSQDIINDMLQNIDTHNYEIEINRKNAIIKGIQKLEKNDILLLLGKGHENYQIIGKDKLPFSDINVVKNNL